ncbi:MAG: hypothetical protein KAG97_09915 [Victivallales bacterium]|nr:hypothetical protein [Victivallales bacterium]
MTDPKRIRRSEAFLGIHFDAHANETSTAIGEGVTEEMIEEIIARVKPDYIQIDCKGHRGLCSYPTKVGNPAPGFKNDPLKLWREVTSRRGVALFMHYSGVFDTEAVRNHPSWAVVDENGRRDPDMTSVFGPYGEKLLIPQFKELADKYGVDGVWVDGECWACKRDYSPKTLKRFKKATGIKRIPKKPGDKYFREFNDFCRQGFRDYLRKYVDVMHAFDPDFQIASNWTYSGHMPEKPEVDVDFLSGDYSQVNSYNSARFEARVLASQGKPWDLMAWSFRWAGEDSANNTKSVVQLQQEAAPVLAMGGGFQAYFKQKQKNCAIEPWTMRLMEATAKFCRERQKSCHRAKPAPQIALLLSTHSFYKENPTPFLPTAEVLNRLKGTLNALLDARQTVEIHMEHTIENQMDEYPLIVLPNWSFLKRKFKSKLLRYVKNGGNLLVIGPDSARLFKKELGLKSLGETKTKSFWVKSDGWLAGINTAVASIKPLKTTEILAKTHSENDFNAKTAPAAVLAEFGKGRIAGVCFDFGSYYYDHVSCVSRDWLATIVKRLFPDPIVNVSGAGEIDVHVNELDGRLMVHLINADGPHANSKKLVFDELPRIGPLEVAVRCSARPKKVTLLPEGTCPTWRYKDGAALIEIQDLGIHQIVEIEEKTKR